MLLFPFHFHFLLPFLLLLFFPSLVPKVLEIFKFRKHASIHSDTGTVPPTHPSSGSSSDSGFISSGFTSGSGFASSSLSSGSMFFFCGCLLETFCDVFFYFMKSIRYKLVIITVDASFFICVEVIIKLIVRVTSIFRCYTLVCIL